MAHVNSIGISLDETPDICIQVMLEGYETAIYLHGSYAAMHHFADLVHAQAVKKEQEDKEISDSLHRSAP